MVATVKLLLKKKWWLQLFKPDGYILWLFAVTGSQEACFTIGDVTIYIMNNTQYNNIV